MKAKKSLNLKLEKDRKEFIKIAKKYFNENGIELTPENGEKIPKDPELQSGSRSDWSIDVFVLTETGIRKAYYRGKDPNFTVTGVSFFDLYLKDVKMASNKFLYSVEDLVPLVEHLTVNQL